MIAMLLIHSPPHIFYCLSNFTSPSPSLCVTLLLYYLSLFILPLLLLSPHWHTHTHSHYTTTYTPSLPVCRIELSACRQIPLRWRVLKWRLCEMPACAVMNADLIYSSSDSDSSPSLMFLSPQSADKYWDASDVFLRRFDFLLFLCLLDSFSLSGLWMFYNMCDCVFLDVITGTPPYI